MITNYAVEANMSRSLVPSDTCCRDLYACLCKESSGEDQLSLERRWNANSSSEFIVNTYITRSGEVTHKTKGKTPSPDRIHKIERQNPRWAQTFNRISQWKCRKCPYGSEDMPYHRITATDTDVEMMDTASPLVPPQSCLLDGIDEDVLFVLASHLPSESLLSFSAAYSRLDDLVKSTHVLLQRELRCFFLRTSLQDSVLGIGITFDAGPRTLSSDFDWLSELAFTTYGVRKSIQKRDLNFFLPLAFSRTHFDRVQTKIWAYLAEIDRGVRAGEMAINHRTGRTSNRQTAPPSQAHETVGVIYKMMNNIVVSLMKSCDDVLGAARNNNSSKANLLHASEKAVISYCHLFHLLICLCRTNPNVLGDATARLQRFIAIPASRIKRQVPDIGELIVLVTLVLALPQLKNTSGPPVTWAVLNGPFLQEAIIRNVRWVLKDSPELEILEAGACDYRLAETFHRSKTSLRLIMFQITFLDIFLDTYASNLSRLDDNYGFAEKGLPERMVEEVKEIYKVNDWPTFFAQVKYTRGVSLGKEKFSEMLRDAVRTSGERGYHTPKRGRELHLMSSQREHKERAWNRAHRERR